MLTVPHHTSKEITGKKKQAFQRVSPKPFSDSLATKSNTTNFRFFKRLSPFLSGALLLPPYAAYTLIAGIHIFNNLWLQLFVFTGIEVYLFFLDFVLWNYFEGKRKLQIWIIEIVLSFLVIRLFI